MLYENISRYCTFCKHLVHDIKGCKWISQRKVTAINAAKDTKEDQLGVPSYNNHDLEGEGTSAAMPEQVEVNKELANRIEQEETNKTPVGNETDGDMPNMTLQSEKETTNIPLMDKNSSQKRSRHKGKGISKIGKDIDSLYRYNIILENTDQSTVWENNWQNFSTTLEQLQANKRHIPTKNTFELLA